jgi:hypothetical protein
VAGVEGVEGLLDEVEGMAVEELALFISAIHSICGRRGTPIFARFLAGSLPRPALRSSLLRAPAKKQVKCDFHAKCTFPLLFRLSSLLNRRGHQNFSSPRSPLFLTSAIHPRRCAPAIRHSFQPIYFQSGLATPRSSSAGFYSTMPTGGGGTPDSLREFVSPTVIRYVHKLPDSEQKFLQNM